MRNQFIFLFLLFVLTVIGQNTKIDSLKQEIISATDTTKIRLLNDIGIEYTKLNFDESLKYINMSIKLSNKCGFKLQKARSYNTIGNIYSLKEKYSLAYLYYKKSLEYSEQLNNSSEQKIALYNIVDLYWKGLSNNEINLKSALDKIIKLSSKSNIEFSLILAFYKVETRLTLSKCNDFNLDAYFQQLDTKKYNWILPIISLVEALHFQMNDQNFKAIQKINDALKNSNEEAIRLASYELMANVNFITMKYENAIYYSKEAIKIVNKSFDPVIKNRKLLIESIIGSAYVFLNKYNEAYPYVYAYLHSDKVSPANKSATFNNMALIYINIDSLKQARFCIDKSLEISRKNKIYYVELDALCTKIELINKSKNKTELESTVNAIKLMIDKVDFNYSVYAGYDILSKYYKKNGDYKQALMYNEKLMIVNDSLKAKEAIKSLEEFQVKYETEKKEQQILLQQNELKSKTILLSISICAALLILIALIIIIFLYKRRNEAYKQLVYQSIQHENSSLVLIPENEGENATSSENEVKVIQLSEEQKKQIQEFLNKQIELKVYLQSEININRLAELCITNRTYLSQFINETYRTNFNTFINKLRIDEAKRLLIERKNDIQLKNLYLELGFNTYNVFNEAFKKHVGVTPAFFVRTINEDTLIN